MKGGMNVVYCNFSKAFDTVFDNIIPEDKVWIRVWTMRWTEKLLKIWAQKVVISSTKSSWRQVTSGTS